MPAVSAYSICIRTQLTSSDRATEKIHIAEHRAAEHAEKKGDWMKEAGHCEQETASVRVARQLKFVSAEIRLIRRRQCAYDKTGRIVETERELEAAKEHHRHVTHAHTDVRLHVFVGVLPEADMSRQEEVHKPVTIAKGFNATEAFYIARDSLLRVFQALNPMNWRHH